MSLASQPRSYEESCEYPSVIMNSEGELQAILKHPVVPVF